MRPVKANPAQTVHDMALVIAANRRPLADAVGLRGVVNRAGFSPDEVHAHFTAALIRASTLRMDIRRVAA